MNTYYTTRDFEFLRNRPVVLESEALAEIEKLQAKLERAALSESADVSREIDYGNKIASLEPASGARSAPGGWMRAAMCARPGNWASAWCGVRGRVRWPDA